MYNITEEKIVILGAALAKARGVSESRIANLAGRDGGFFRRLRNGKSCRLDTAKRMLDFFSSNWPANLPWPDCVDRPVKKGAAA